MMRKVRKVAIVTTGNEVLNGDVLDTNSNWLCKRMAGIGGYVESVALTRDDVDAIAREIRAALSRQADLVVTVGGLGPTADDLTLEAVARATDRELAPHPEALAQVTRKYLDLTAAGAVQNATMTPAREKMAFLPQGAKPLLNSVGAAPGVYLNVGSSAVVSLPGVPAEMRGIVEGSLQPILGKLFGHSVFVEKTMIVASGDESLLAPILATVAHQYPDVYIKSHARRFGPDVKFRVTVSQASSSRSKAEQAVSATIQSLGQAFATNGISMSPSGSTDEEG
jgi:molybdenum cofactor synthesis domain-containing protein